MAIADIDPSDAKLVEQARAAAAKRDAEAKAAELANLNASRDALTKLTGGQTLTNEEKALLNIAPTPAATTATTDTTTTKTTSVVTANRTLTNKIDNKNGTFTLVYSDGTAEVIGTAAQPVTAKPTIVRQKTVRKTGGVVQTVNVMSDGSEQVLDEYKDYSARDAVMAMFENTGLGDTFLNSLMNSIDQVYNDNIAPTDSQILNSIYNSDAYKTRFAANETIRKRMAEGKARPGDRLLKPAEYIETESTYRQIMSAAGLPAGFYDSQDDFSNFIANGVSASELTSRVNVAKNALQNADQGIVDSLKNFYGLTTSDMVAYLLDKDKAFNLIEGRFNLTTAEAEKQYGAAEIGGAAQRAGMVSDKALAEEIYGAGKGAQAEAAFQSAAEKKADYRRLRNLYGQTGEDTDLVRQELALAGGAESAVATKKLASKERAKFQQGSAITQTSLGRRNRLADV